MKKNDFYSPNIFANNSQRPSSGWQLPTPIKDLHPQGNIHTRRTSKKEFEVNSFYVLIFSSAIKYFPDRLLSSRACFRLVDKQRSS